MKHHLGGNATPTRNISADAATNAYRASGRRGLPPDFIGPHFVTEHQTDAGAFREWFAFPEWFAWADTGNVGSPSPPTFPRNPG